MCVLWIEVTRATLGNPLSDAAKGTSLALLARDEAKGCRHGAVCGATIRVALSDSCTAASSAHSHIKRMHTDAHQRVGAGEECRRGQPTPECRRGQPSQECRRGHWSQGCRRARPFLTSDGSVNPFPRVSRGSPESRLSQGSLESRMSQVSPR